MQTNEVVQQLLRRLKRALQVACLSDLFCGLCWHGCTARLLLWRAATQLLGLFSSKALEACRQSLFVGQPLG
jgi:hypothetical protein